MYLFFRSAQGLGLVRLLPILLLASLLISCQQSKLKPQNDLLSLDQDSAVIMDALLESLRNEQDIPAIDVRGNSTSSSLLNTQSLCATLTYDKELKSRSSSMRVYLKEVTARDLGLSRGYHTFTQRLNKAAGSSLLVSFIFHYHNNTITLLSKASPNTSTNSLVTAANINPDSQYWIGVLTNESWDFPPLQISGNCQTAGQNPQLVSVSPNQPRITSWEQWITIKGQNIERDATAVFYAPDNKHIVIRSSDSGKHQYVNSNKLRVKVKFHVYGNFGVQVFNQKVAGRDRPSNVISITVPDIPQSDGFDYPFGNRTNSSGWYRSQKIGSYYSGLGYHLGDDWSKSGGASKDCGKEVYAASDGKIVYANSYYSRAWGGVVLARSYIGSTNSEREMLYGHLERLTVSSGDIVKRGQVIGYITSNVPWPCHLHLELRDSSVHSSGGSQWGRVFNGYLPTKSAAKNSGWHDPTDWIESHRP